MADGSGYGNGSGSGITRLDGRAVHDVDGVQTVITSIKGNVAKGYILRSDLTLKPCFIAKVNGHFAHADTIVEAVAEAQNKAFEDLDEEERIEAFREFAVGRDTFTGHELFEWHGKLTGSCKMGREQFVKDRGIDLDKTFTMSEFVALTRGSYGGEIIVRLEEDKL